MPELSQEDFWPLLPHGGAMRLLDVVEQWDAQSITCRSSAHREGCNPLRSGGRLGAIAGLEFAAQAIGVHIGLLQSPLSAGGTIGYVGSARDVTLAVDRLDRLLDDLRIEASRLLAEDGGFIYSCRMTAGGQPVWAGRLSIFLRRAES